LGEKDSMLPLTNIDLRLVYVFLKVVECRGFAAAQSELGLSAPTISTHMASLEERLGCRLCDRGRVGFKLTSKGEIVYEAAQRLFAAMHEFRAKTGSLKGRLAGDLFVGIHDNTVTDPNAPFHRVIDRFIARGARVHIHLQIASPQELHRKLVEGSLHVVVGIAPKTVDVLEYEPLYREDVRLFCSKDHPLFTCPDEDVTIDDIRSANVVSRGYWKERDLDYLGLDASAATVWDMETQLILIRSGHYVGLLPIHYAQRWVEQGELRALLSAELQFETTVYIISRRGGEKTLVLRKFLEDLRQVFAEAQQNAPAQVVAFQSKDKKPA
jgi:DNA-binding transcriptional LysR family regulator